jgi:hypothetical protein
MSRTFILLHTTLLIGLFILALISQASNVAAGSNVWSSTGMSSDTHAISISSVPPGEAAIDGLLTGVINTAYTFTVTVNPITTTMPITYIWAATEQSDVIQVKDSPQASVEFTWIVTGAKVVTATAINQDGQISSLPHTIQIITPQYVYLPFIVHAIPTCLANVLTNGDFEQGHTGWYTYTNASWMWWKQHDLIGSDAQGFEPYQGHYAARLGGYEGVWDSITQTVVIPVQGSLTYWWKGWTYDTRPKPDTFDVALLNQNGTQIALLAHHDDQNMQTIWKQDVIDVAAYAGQALTLRFSSHNNNYNSAWFNLDTICLSTVSSH